MSTQINISPEIKLVVNTTPITGGSAGQILFQTTGNTVGESANLFWDNTNARLRVNGAILAGNGFCSLSNALGGYGTVGSNYYYNGNSPTRWAADHVAQIDFGLGFRFRVAGTGASGSAISFSELGYWSSTTGNLLVGTTTDAGFRLDVNGTARATSYTLGNFIINQSSANQFIVSNPSGASGQLFLYGGTTSQANIQIFGSSGGNTNNILFNVGATARAVIFGSTGNIGINTTTDAGFRLDVNGTARVKTTDSSTPLNVAHSGSVGIQVEANSNGYRLRLASSNTNAAITTPDSYLSINSGGQLVVIGSTSTYNSAQVAIDSTTKGFLPPRMTNAQMVAITTPAEGLVVYDLTNKKLCCYDGATWQNLF